MNYPPMNYPSPHPPSYPPKNDYQHSKPYGHGLPVVSSFAGGFAGGDIRGFPLATPVHGIGGFGGFGY
jgi:hypothetical protein